MPPADKACSPATVAPVLVSALPGVAIVAAGHTGAVFPAPGDWYWRQCLFFQLHWPHDSASYVCLPDCDLTGYWQDWWDAAVLVVMLLKPCQQLVRTTVVYR